MVRPGQSPEPNPLENLWGDIKVPVPPRAQSLLYTAWMFYLLWCQVVFQKHLGTVPKSFRASPPTSAALPQVQRGAAAPLPMDASLTNMVHHGVGGLAPLEEHWTSLTSLNVLYKF